jgi:hypothetical protein
MIERRKFPRSLNSKLGRKAILGEQADCSECAQVRGCFSDHPLLNYAQAPVDNASWWNLVRSDSSKFIQTVAPILPIKEKFFLRFVD